MPGRTRDRLAEYADTWSSRSIRAWEEGWWEMPIAVGNLIGRIIGAGAGEVVMLPNVSIAQSIVNSSFEWNSKRNKIVTDALNFPTNLYLFHALERLGAEVCIVPSEDGMTVPLDRMLAAIDERTRLVSASHVIFKSAFVQDMATIAKRAHEMGALIVADLYQSAGAVPLNVREMDVDFATGGSVKWLCGGPGAGYLYVRRDLWPRLEPKMTGWIAHQRPFAFEAEEMDYAADAFRFLNGTPSIPALYAARSGYEIINEIGVERIREKSLRQTQRLMDLADEAGFKVNTPRKAEERGGTVTLDVPNGHEIVKELLRRDILVDFRPGAGIRVAPHFYTSDEELDVVIREIQGLLASSRVGA